MTALVCRLCGLEALEIAFELPNAPRNVAHLPTAAQLTSDHAVHLTVWRCAACDFVQLTSLPDDDFYEQYLMTRSHSRTMQAYETALASEFVERFDLQGASVVEVGCGDGQYLSTLANAGANPSGIEPSARFRDIAVHRFPCFHAYIGPDTPAPGGPYAAFVTRQVLEHVIDPKGFLLGVRASLVAGGAGLIEVPSLEQSIEHGRFFDFFPDHVNYFNARTLRLAAELAGFDVEEIRRAMDDEYLIAFVRARKPEDVDSLRAAAETIVSELRAFIGSEQEAGRRVAVWGAGGKGITALAAAGVEGIAYVVDSDPHKQQRFTPVSRLRIVEPDMLARDPVDTVIVTALAYSNEILQQLRGELGFTGRIAVLARPLRILS